MRRSARPTMRGKERSSRISIGRRAWLKLWNVTLIAYRVPGEFFSNLPAELVPEYEKHIDKFGDEVILSFNGNYRRWSTSLTEYTLEELDAFRHFINTTIDIARPIVESRDKLAREMYDEHGSDAESRLYRNLPQLFAREGDVDKYRPSVHDGSSPAPVVGGNGLRFTPLVPSLRADLAERDQGERVSSDDGEATDLDEVLREVGKDQRGGDGGPF